MTKQMTIGIASFKLIVMNNDFSEIELRRLDLNLLLVFSAVMREGSVGAATQRLFLGPSAVSMALARLRLSLGDELFVRAGKGVAPTPRAELLWSAIQPALSTIDGALRVPDFDPAKAEHTVRFAAPDDLEFVLVPALLKRLETVAPGVRLTVRPADFRSIAERLDSGEADVAFSAVSAKRLEKRHHVEIIHREHFRVLYDPARIGRRGKLSFDDYLSVPHLIRSVSGDTSGAIDEALAALHAERTVVAGLSSFATMPFVLKSRPALANVPATAALHLADTFDLETCALPFPSPTFDVGLVWHARLDADPASAWIRGLLHEVIGEIVGSAKEKRSVGPRAASGKGRKRGKP